MKALSVLLVVFLLSIQAQLWFGKGGLSRTVQLQSQLSAQQAANQVAQARNAQIEAELLDLREGLEMVEEKARAELDMVKPDEIYVQIKGARRATLASDRASPVPQDTGAANLDPSTALSAAPSVADARAHWTTLPSALKER